MNQFPFPCIQSLPQNRIQEYLASIEAELKKINAKLDKLDKTKSNSNTYIQQDDNLYML